MAAQKSFNVTRPSLDDASRIAEIHVAAMDENPLLHVQCPTPQSILSLQKFLEKEVIGYIRDNESGILVARDPVTDVIVGFARWTSPSDSPNSVKLEESASGARDIEGCRYEYLDGYVALAEKAKERVMLGLLGGRLGDVGEKEGCYRKCREAPPCLFKPLRSTPCCLAHVRGRDSEYGDFGVGPVRLRDRRNRRPPLFCGWVKSNRPA